MAEPGLKIEEVFKKVRVEVREKTKGEQTPWELTSLTGDFYPAGERGAGTGEAHCVTNRASARKAATGRPPPTWNLNRSRNMKTRKSG